MANEGDSLIREVEEELRKERLKKFWESYGVYVIAAAVALVFGVGGYKLWEARKLAAAQTAGAQFQTALNLLEKSKAEDGIKVLEILSKGGHEGYATLAKLRLAGQAIEAKKPGDAVEYFEQVAKDTSADPLFRDFAVLRIASLKLGEDSWTDTKNRLTEIAKLGRPWRHAARELIGLAAYKDGKMNEARQALAELVGDAKVPPSIAQRAQIVLGLITAKTAPSDAKPKAPGKADGTTSANKAGEPVKKN